MCFDNKLTTWQQRGFTLLEIMLALGLTSVIMLGAMSFLSQGVNAWTKSDAMITASERELIAMNFLRKTIAESYAVEVGINEDTGAVDAAVGAANAAADGSDTTVSAADVGVTEKMTAFWGESDKLYLVGTLPVHHGKPMGLYLFGFMVEDVPESEETALVVKYWPIDWTSIEATLATEPDYEMLLDGVTAMSLEYFGNVEDDNGELASSTAPVAATEANEPVLEWTSNWIEKEELPMAVKLSLTRSEFNEDSERPPYPNWQDIYIKVAHRYIK